MLRCAVLCCAVPQVLSYTEPKTAALRQQGIDLSAWNIPKGYRLHTGAQLE